MNREGSAISYIERNCEVHGRLGDTVYRRKRNGEEYKYAYEYVARYEPTVLSRRSDCIVRQAAGFTNPQKTGYKPVIRKLYYYTPYIVYAGEYEFSCNTFYKLRSKGLYNIVINEGLGQYQRLAPRSKVKYRFDREGEFVLRCYNGGVLYSERKVLVISDETALEEAYSEWYAENLTEILAQPEPAFASLPAYGRYLRSKGIFINLSGKVHDFVIYPAKQFKYMYSRQIGSYEHNEQTHYFCEVMPRVLSCWKSVSAAFLEEWEKYYIRWLGDHLRANRAVGRHHLWSKAVFGAATGLGFDLTTLAVDNWLPGVETLGDLLEASGNQGYGLTSAELGTRIYISEKC